MADFDFKKLGDLDMIDEVQDDDTVLVVRDGKVYRADGSGLGGSGGYVVDVAPDEFRIGSDEIIITTPIPGLLDAVDKGATVTMKGDLGLIISGEVLDIPMYVPLTGCVDYGKILALSDTTGYENAGTVYGGCNLNEAFISVLLTNGINIDEESAVSTAVLTDEEPTVHPLIAGLNKLKEKREARKNVENTD